MQKHDSLWFIFYLNTKKGALKFNPGVGEMAQWVGVLVVQGVEPVCIPSTHIKDWTWLCLPVTPALRGRNRQILGAC